MLKYFLYSRKSSEEEERQVLSNKAQVHDLLELFRDKHNLSIRQVLVESRSAKTPGRPVFNRMIQRIERGEAQGIISWHPDRLARNGVDGGQIIDLLDRGKLKDLKFATYTFENTPEGKLMLAILFAQAKHYSDKLSCDIRRGNLAKLREGWLPGPAFIGYLNNKENQTIVKDPERFPLVKRIWELVERGRPAHRVHKIATEHWGLTTPIRKKVGGKPLSMSGLYRVLANPFYCGLISRKGEIYEGKHPPMISADTFEHVQEILGRKLKRKRKTHEFAFTGLIRCGQCGAAITAEDKVNRYGTEYTYYRCTRHKKKPCHQLAIRVEELERQILTLLDRITIPDRFLDWARRYLARKHKDDASVARSVQKSRQRALRSCQTQIDNLVSMRLRELIDDQEFAQNKKRLALQKRKLEEQLAKPESADSFALSEGVFRFANHAKKWFQRGSLKQKRLILQSVSSHLVLLDKKLHSQVKKPFLVLQERASFPSWWSVVEDVSTFCRKEKENLWEFKQAFAKLEVMNDHADHGSKPRT